jgi:transcriptional regulator with XRE-family HTH domain
MSYFGTELARLMAARGLGVRELARMVPCNPGHISNLRSGKAQPSPELAQALDERLGAGGTLRALGPARVHHRPEPAVAWDDGAADEIAALDLGRLAEATEVGTGTVERLELAVDELATAYPGTPPAELLGRVRAYLAYLGRLLDARTTLAEHRRLLVVGGWLSLLAGTTLIDLHRDHAAAAGTRPA